MEWTEKEEVELTKKYPNYSSIKGLASDMERSVRSIKQKAARLGLSRGKTPLNKPKNKEYRQITEKKYREKNRSRIYYIKQKRVRDIKAELIALLGGKCSKCGYSKCEFAMDFHHNTGNKENNMAHIIKNKSRQKALKEAEKCILLCANCHREVHSKGV
jgi:predicted HNH restriction endonuclease